MIKKWFNCTVKYMKIDDNGNESVVTEQYLVDADSYTEAEARIYEEMEQRIRGEFVIKKVIKTTIQEVIYGEEALDDFWEAKINLVSYDVDTDKEEKSSHLFLVNADSVSEVIEKVIENFKDNGIDYKIISIKLTPIIDVFFHSGEGRQVDLVDSINEIESENAE